MANIKITLDTKQLYPAVVNLKQFSNNTDVLTFEMENYMYETTDLSKLDAYAVCDMVNQEVDEVKLEKQVVENKLRLTWTVTGYTTQLDGHINYQIVFKNIENDKSVIWFSHQGIIFISESHDADGYIAAKYPTILQQWEERMKTTDANASNAVDQAQSSADTATQKANEASQSAAKAESEATDAETNAAKVEEMRDYINQLINYEGTNFIEKEVVQARKDYDTLGNRLDDMIKGYVVETGNSYEGLASDGGIVVNKIKGAYTESIPEPAPDYQVEPKFFNAKHITSHGRQLFDVNKLASNTVNGITLTSLKDGSLRLSGTATSDASFPVDLTHKETVELFKAGSLYLKGAGMIENAYFTVYLMKSRGETTSELRSDQTISIDQSFLDTESSFVRFYIWIKTGVTVNHIIKPMLYQDGSGEYEPFKYDDVETDIVLRALPNGVHDEYIDGNILRRIGVMILDGSSDELWAKPTTPAMGSGYSRFLSDALKKLYKAPSGTSISNQNIISDRLKVLAGDSEDYKSSNCIVMQYTDDVLRIALEDSITGGTLEGMKTWLSSNPIKVYYELATPVIEEYKIPAIGSYYPFTHVQHDSEVDASEIEWHITATSSNTKNIDDIYAILENKMDKVAVFSEDGEEVVKKIDLGFKMKEEESNVTKGQLLDRDTKGTLYPETTVEQVIGLQDDLDVVNKRFKAKQSLINPDFQINQRGQTTYNQNGYTLDYWYLFGFTGTTGNLTVLDDAISIENTDYQGLFLNQKIDDEYRGKEVVLIGKFSNVNGGVYLQVAEANTIGGQSATYGRIEINTDGIFITRLTLPEKTTYETMKVQVSLMPNSSCEIEYINLFEGDIAYPHVKNKYAYDLMECMEQAERAKFTVTATGSYFMSGFSYKVPKKNQPTVQVLSVWNQDGKVTASDFGLTNCDKYIVNFISYKNGSCASLQGQTFTFDVIVTCEPL